MSDGFVVNEGRCEICDKDAVVKFQIMRKVAGGRRNAMVTSGRWFYVCAEHIDQGASYASSGLVKPKGVR